MSLITTPVARLSALTMLAASLSGCIITSPFWNQEFAARADPVPLQAFTTNKTLTVKFECSQAYHGGLYPAFGPETWVNVTSVMPSQQALLDPKGGKVYGAGTSIVLPAACWHAEETQSGLRYRSAIRASQTAANGGVSKFIFTYDNAGLGCLGQANGNAANWFSTGVSNCAEKYSNTGNAIPFVIFSALS